jgi:dienelactone hydrolase
MSDVSEQVIRHLFKYDRTLPLNPTEETEQVIDFTTGEVRNDMLRERVTFGSTHDERVTATIIAPITDQQLPAVIIQHGSTPLGRHGNISPVTASSNNPTGLEWALNGLLTISIDAYGFGSREKTDNRGRLTPDRPDLMFRTRDQRIQSIQDLMRTVDYLESRTDVDSSAIGYHGISMGTRIGVPFIALDKRIRAASLFVGGSGEYSRFITDNTEFDDLNTDEQLISDLTDPLAFASWTSHIPKFIVNGDNDLTVGGIEPAEKLHAALSDPKEIHWYQGGHGDYHHLLPEALTFFNNNLQKNK